MAKLPGKNQEMPTFVNYELPKEQEQAMRSMGVTLEQVFEFVERVTSDGYKVSFRWDDYNDCAQASLTAPSKDNPNKGLCLTQRGGSAAKALIRLYFVHSVVFDAVWPRDSAKGRWQDTWE